MRYHACNEESVYVTNLNNPFLSGLHGLDMDIGYTSGSHFKNLTKYFPDISGYLQQHLGSTTSAQINLSKFMENVANKNIQFVQMDNAANKFVIRKTNEIKDLQSKGLLYIIVLAVGEALLLI